MKHIISFVFLFFINMCFVNGQANVEWAGPDRESCGEKGVQLGVSTPCPGCCFLWSNAEDLDFADVQNPIARPQKDITYTVTVTNEKLAWRKVDEVKVELSFGEIHFVPDHLEQGTEEIVLAKLQKNTANVATTWSIQGEELGCTITPSPNYNIASLAAGDEYGNIKVRVHKSTDPECYFEETLPVNNGVKDLRVEDLNNPGRFATTDQTLYLVSNDPLDWKAKLIAIPNEGGFADGSPIYKPDFNTPNTPLSGEDEQIVEGIATIFGDQDNYLAGDFPDFDPHVSVIRKIPVETPSGLPALAQNIYNFWQDLENRFEFDQLDYDAPGTPPSIPPCPDSNPLTFERSLGVGFKDH